MGARSGRGLSRRADGQAASSREATVRSYLHRWAEAAGAQLLVVDPYDDRAGLADAMAGRGVHVTWVASTVDGLIEYGRLDPHAVVVAPDAPGLPAPDFVAAIRRHGTPYVVAALEQADPAEVGSLMLAGASAVVVRPYTAAHLWELLSHSPRSLAERAHVVVGRIELDAASYRVLIDGERIADLPLKEFELLRTLMLRAPDVVTDEELRRELWGATARSPSSNTIAMHVARLRSRLGDAATVRRIRGRGYALAAEKVR